MKYGDRILGKAAKLTGFSLEKRQKYPIFVLEKRQACFYVLFTLACKLTFLVGDNDKAVGGRNWQCRVENLGAMSFTKSALQGHR